MNHERLRLWGVVAGAAVIIGWILLPPNAFHGYERHNARRVSCQWNLRQIGLAVAIYSQDYDDFLPRHSWVAPLLPYTGTDKVFQCSETRITPNTTDYFWNARYFGTARSRIMDSKTLILFGDGQDDAPLNANLSSLPQAWRDNENSPAYRHMNGANYGFADGHVKWFKPDQITNVSPSKTGGPTFAIR